MSPWTILFVDDDRDFLDAQAAFFGSRGHTVHTVESSQEALDFLEAGTPDIIFIDLMMERYDSGFRLAYEIRKSVSPRRRSSCSAAWPAKPESASTKRVKAFWPGPGWTALWINRLPANSCWA
jgi:CheY-like chemotaxis protein